MGRSFDVSKHFTGGNPVIYVDTVSDLQALDTSGLVEGQQASVGEAGMFVWSGSEWLPKNSETITVSIPGEFASYQEAIDALSNFKISAGAIIDLVGEEGWQPVSGISLANGDYRHFRISHSDGEVILPPEFIGSEFINAFNCTAPMFNILIDCANVSLGNAINIREASSIVISDGCGAKNNTSGRGILVYNSRAHGNQCIFSGCQRGLQITHASQAWFERVDASGCSEEGAFVSRGAIFYGVGGDYSDCDVGVLVRRATFVGIPFGGTTSSKFDGCGIAVQTFTGGKAIISSRGVPTLIENTLSHGVEANSGSEILADGCLFNNIPNDAVRVFASEVTLTGTEFVGIGRDIISAAESSIVHADGIIAPNSAARIRIRGASLASLSNADLSGNTHPTNTLSVETGGIVNANDLDISGVASIALSAFTGGVINALRVNASGAGDSGAAAEKGGRVAAEGGDLSGCSNRGAIAREGGSLVLTNANVRKGSEDSSGDLVCVRGSIVHFFDGIGGTNISVNAVSSDGIIFR